MTSTDTPSRHLRLTPEALVAAAGGYDALVAELASQSIDVVSTAIEAGHDDLQEALLEFANAWFEGLAVLTQSQRERGDSLRKVASTILGVDVDVAYAALAAVEGLDLR